MALDTFKHGADREAFRVILTRRPLSLGVTSYHITIHSTSGGGKRGTVASQPSTVKTAPDGDLPRKVIHRK